jgi:N-acyl-L-homoserine lactone synthetase
MSDLIPRRHLYSVQASHEQRLPFRVRMAQGNADLRHAVAVRTQAYDRHVPGMAKVLQDPEPDDYRDDAVLLIAESKTDGQVLGSIRLLTNSKQALHLEHETRLPTLFHHRRLLEAWRLTVHNCEQGRLVACALYKSLYEISFHACIDHVLVVARRPVDRLYKAMQFKDALNGQKLTLSNTLNLPHGLFYLPVREADALWRSAQCPLYPFMALTRHPDIEIDHAMVHRRFNQATLKTGGARAVSPHFENMPC